MTGSVLGRPPALVGLAGVAALLLPAPEAVSVAGLATAGGVAALVVAVRRPGSVAPLVLIALTIVSWIAGGSAGVPRTVAFAIAVFAVHSTAALAAAVPAGCRPERGVLLRWAGRATVTVGVGLGVVALTAQLAAPPGSVARTAIAVLVSAALLLVPALASARSPEGTAARADHSDPRRRRASGGRRLEGWRRGRTS